MKYCGQIGKFCIFVGFCMNIVCDLCWVFSLCFIFLLIVFFLGEFLGLSNLENLGADPVPSVTFLSMFECSVCLNKLFPHVFGLLGEFIYFCLSFEYFLGPIPFVLVVLKKSLSFEFRFPYFFIYYLFIYLLV